MNGNYPYIISSLPMLHFGMKAPFSFDKLISMLKSIISEEEHEIIRNIYAGNVYDYSGRQETIKKYRDFEIALRNELVKLRAPRKKMDQAKYQRADGHLGVSVSHIALGAYRTPSLIAAEKTLDEERWRFLEELSFDHYFDFDLLIIYAFELMILERWDRINQSNPKDLLEASLNVV